MEEGCDESGRLGPPLMLEGRGHDAGRTLGRDLGRDLGLDPQVSTQVISK